jgi:hypothetical protein
MMVGILCGLVFAFVGILAAIDYFRGKQSHR